MDNQPVIADESEVIRQQMEETRTSLTEKLETLEQTVKDTVTDATDAVSDTVQSVKDAVQETVDTVKDTVSDSVAAVKNSFDVVSHVRERPWMMMIGAAATGFVGGRLLSAMQPRSSMPAPAAYTPVAQQTMERFGVPPQSSSPSWMSRLAEHYGDELGKLKGLALATVCGIVRDSVATAVAPAIGQRLTEVIDDLTVKMGGQPIPGPILPMPERTDGGKAQSTGRTDREHNGAVSAAAW